MDASEFGRNNYLYFTGGAIILKRVEVPLGAFDRLGGPDRPVAERIKLTAEQRKDLHRRMRGYPVLPMLANEYPPEPITLTASVLEESASGKPLQHRLLGIEAEVTCALSPRLIPGDLVYIRQSEQWSFGMILNSALDGDRLTPLFANLWFTAQVHIVEQDLFPASEIMAIGVEMGCVGLALEGKEPCWGVWADRLEELEDRRAGLVRRLSTTSF